MNFIQENGFENVVCKMVVILSWHQCVKQPWNSIAHNNYHIQNPLFLNEDPVSNLSDQMYGFTGIASGPYFQKCDIVSFILEQWSDFLGMSIILNGKLLPQ